MKITELKPCPFCGAEPFMQEIEPHTHSGPLQAIGIPDHPGSWTIECPTDGCCGMIASTREKIVANWNRRYPYELPEEQAEEVAAPQAQRIAELEKQVQVARQAVEDFMGGLYRVPQYGDRVNKEVRQKLAEAYSPILNLPAMLDSMELAAKNDA